jgi:hypothetical protein
MRITRITPRMLDGPYPQLELYPHRGYVPIPPNRRISRTIRSKRLISRSYQESKTAQRSNLSSRKRFQLLSATVATARPEEPSDQDTRYSTLCAANWN